MAAEPADAQNAFWNGPAGATWAENATELDALSAEAGAVLLAAAAFAPGERVLDIGCGTGATSLAAARAVGPSGRVTGIDISAPMLAGARAARERAGLGNLDLIEGDAARHPLPEAGFDAIVSRFGVMFFADPVAAFRAIGRTLRPGGRIVFVAWAGPEANPWFTVARRVAEARLGPSAEPPAAPEAPGPMAFRDLDRVRGILTAAGLDAVTGETHAIALGHPGGIAGLGALSVRVGPAAARLREAAAAPETAAALREDLARAFAAFDTPAGPRIPAAIHLLRGLRPMA